MRNGYDCAANEHREICEATLRIGHVYMFQYTNVYTKRMHTISIEVFGKCYPLSYAPIVTDSGPYMYITILFFNSKRF